MSSCTKHAHCPSNNCDQLTNRCKNVGMYGDPCKRAIDCADGMICHPEIKRCRVQGVHPTPPCVTDWDCPVNSSCRSGVCMRLKGEGGLCSWYGDCSDGLGCHSGRCALKCIENLFGCPDGQACSYGICVPAEVEEPAAEATPPPPPQPQPAPPKPAENKTSTFQIRSHLGLTLFGVSVVAVIIAGLVIFFLLRRNKRRQAKMNLEYPTIPPQPPIPPPMPFYQEAPSAPPPSYEESGVPRPPTPEKKE